MDSPAPLRRLLAAWQSSADRIAGSDPGFNRLILASRGSLTILLALAAEWLFVHGTGALEVGLPAHPTPAQTAAVVVQHHDILVVAMLLGGLVGLMTAMNVNERTLAGQAITLVYIPAVLIGSLAIGLELGPDRVPALGMMVVLVTAGTYSRRFGPRGAPAGILLFLGYFYGFFLSATLPLSAIGWLAAEVLVAVGTAAVVRLVAFRPSPASDLRRAMRSYAARARRVTVLALAFFDAPDERGRRALHRWLIRLDEAALIVEGQLDTPRALPEGGAVQLHQSLFDVELALTNAARFVEVLATVETREVHRALVRQAMASLARGDPEAAHAAVRRLRSLAPAGQGRGTGSPQGGEGSHGDAAAPGGAPQDAVPWPLATVDNGPSHQVVLHRFTLAIEVLAGALPAWTSALPDRTPGPGGVAYGDTGAGRGAEPAFQPAVPLRAGWLPGSADVSTEASALPGARVRLAPYLRTSAQMTVAVTIAIVAGDALDAQRFYWAVVAAVLVLVGTNTVAEQLRKATYRVVGTLVGVVAGTALVDAVGTHSLWSLVVVVVSAWLGMYLFRVNYAFMAMAITVSLSQAYLSLGEFSGGLLAERLAETAVGAGAAMATVLVVVPLRTRRVLDVAAADLIETVSDLANTAVEVLENSQTASSSGDRVPDGEPPPTLHAAARRVDGAYQALVATAAPLRMVSWADSQDRLDRLMAAATAARNYGRNLVFDAAAAGPRSLDEDALAGGRRILTASAANLAARLRMSSPADTIYTRSGSLFAAAECALAADGGPPSPEVLVLRDLALVDGALARIASWTGMALGALDTEPLVGTVPGSGGAGGHRDDPSHPAGRRGAGA